MWIWTARVGFEADLIEELGRARLAQPALVESDARPASWPVFARAGFPVHATVAPADVAAAAASALDAAFARGAPTASPAGGEAQRSLSTTGKRGFSILGWVPDADATNPLASRADALAQAVASSLRADLASRLVARADDSVRYGGYLLQLLLAGPERVLVGVLPAQDAPSLVPGGRARARAPKDAPSRAARKLAEAFEWIGRTPEAGDVCVDLGAAPGGWTAVLLQHKAQVVAVDPANLAPEFRARKGVVHVKASAFDFEPDERVDWLFCDMAWRPLEVAQSLAKWGRRKLAGALVANVKLPMKQRAPFVKKIVETVAGGGWQDVRARQLYHDREEITLSGWRT